MTSWRVVRGRPLGCPTPMRPVPRSTPPLVERHGGRARDVGGRQRALVRAPPRLPVLPVDGDEVEGTTSSPARKARTQPGRWSRRRRRPDSMFRLPPPARTPKPMSPTRIRRPCCNSRLSNCVELVTHGLDLPSFAPMTPDRACCCRCRRSGARSAPCRRLGLLLRPVDLESNRGQRRVDDVEEARGHRVVGDRDW